ncbi:DUF2795 domain-containing protein [Mycolicibacterium wolinskyi]|uniref:DUF2795 domain-containing protein n=1 Tax=Mycolicibacterium wolinskyi TaxID=59750 RepID=UPI0039176802
MPNPIDVQKALSGAKYPSSKQDLIEHAKTNGADSEIIDALGKLTVTALTSSPLRSPPC